MRWNSCTQIPPSFWMNIVEIWLGFHGLVLLGTLIAAPLCAQTAHYSGAQSAVMSVSTSQYGLGLNGIAVDGDGNVYAADSYAEHIKKAPWTGGGYGDQVSVANVAHGVAVDKNGNVYTGDYDRVVKIPWTGSGYGAVAQVDGIADPRCVAVDGNGNVYSSEDSGYGQVVKVPWTGSSYGTKSVVLSHYGVSFLNWVTGVAVDGIGNVYIAARYYGTLKVPWTGSGYGEMTKIYGTTDSSGSSNPSSVAVDGNGNVYLGIPDTSQVLKLQWTGSGYAQPVGIGSGFSSIDAVAVDGSGNVYIGDRKSGKVVKYFQGAADFGTMGVGKKSPTISVLFTFDTAGSLNNAMPYLVSTQGATGLDFGDAGGGSCHANQSYNAGDTCTVNVAFTPGVAGPRMGAVVLKDASGKVIATAYLHGIGLGPQLAFGPGSRSIVNNVKDPGSLAVDTAGNLYIGDVPNGQLVKVPWTGSGYGTSITVASGLAGPYGVAVDGAGNVYIGDKNNNRVVKVPWTGSGFGTQTTVGSILNQPRGVAVDGDGNVYVAESGNNAVVKVPWTGSGYGAQSAVAVFDAPLSVAVDGSGNLYVAESGANQVAKVPWTGSSYDTPIMVGSGLHYPASAVVDAGGSVYVADNANQRVVKVPWMGSSYGTQSTIVDSGLSPSFVAAIDSVGNVYIVDKGLSVGVIKLNMADPPSLSFSSRDVGTVSPAQDVAVENIGNAQLKISQISTAANFVLQGPNTDCSSPNEIVGVGSSCTLGIEFAPREAGNISGEVILTDNVLTTPQKIKLSGTAIKSASSIDVASSAADQIYGGSLTFTAQINPSVATGTVTFYDGDQQLGQTQTVIGGQAILTISSLRVGLHLIKAIYSGDAGYIGSQGYVEQTITSATPVITWATPAEITSSTILTSAQLNATASVPGTFAYSPEAGIALPPGIHTLSAIFTPNDVLDYTTVSTTVPVKVNPSSIVLGHSSPPTLIELTFVTSGTLGSISVLTQGVRNLDFQQASGGTCVTGTSYSANDTCSVFVTFTPKFPGQRMGAVLLQDGSGNVLATTYISGTGQGPQIAFSPATQSAVETGRATPAGVAVDGSGNLYFGDGYNHRVVKVLLRDGGGYGSQTTVASGISEVTAVAVDGAGNVYIADANNTRIVKIPWTGSGYGPQSTVGNGLSVPADLAVDANGNIYVADLLNSRVVKVPWTSAGYGPQSTVVSGLYAYGIAVDGSANVYLADADNSRVVKVPWTGTGYGPQSTVANGLNQPGSVTVDGSGDIYVVNAQSVVKVSRTDSGYGPQSTMASGLWSPKGLAVDGSGNLYIADSKIVKVDVTNAPSLNFPETSVGAVSPTQDIVVENIGNAPLHISQISTTANFNWQSQGANCASNGQVLDAASSCTLRIEFAPRLAGSISGSIRLSDDTLNHANAGHTISLAGDGKQATTSTVVTASINSQMYGGDVTFTAVVTPTPVTGGTVTFFDDTVPLNTAEAASSGQATLTISSLTVGAHTIKAVYSGNDDYKGSSGTITETITQATPVVTWPTPADITYGTPLSETQLNANTTVDGTWSYTPSPGTVLNAAASHKLNVKFTPNDTSTYTTAMASVTLEVKPASASVTPTPTSKIYGAADPTYTGTLTGFLPADNVVASYTRTAGETVAGGHYKISATLSPTAVLDNYDITYNTASFTINKASASVTPRTTSKTYGRSDPEFTGTLAGFLPADNVVASYTRTAGETVAGGSYKISATLSPSAVLDNYDIDYGTAQFTINRASASVVPTASSKTYGMADPTLAGTLTGFLPGDNITASYTRTVGETVAGDPYKISATLSPTDVLDNYDINYKTADFTINKVSASVIPTKASKIYGESDPEFTGTFSGFLPADKVNATYTRTAGEAVGGSPYTISAILNPIAVLGNYDIDYKTADFTINKVSASVIPTKASKIYGESDPEFTGALSGFLPADNVTASYSRTVGETVAGGPYAISAALSPTVVLGNYNITYKTADFTINRVSASVTPIAASKTYGAADPVLTGNLTGFVPSDNVTASYSRTAGETVAGGPYRISATLSPTAALNNYDISYKTADFTITQASASVTPMKASKIYGTSDPEFTGTLNGFVPADNVTASYSRKAGETVAGSPYMISATLSPTAVLDNYDIAYGTAEFNIAKATTTVTLKTSAPTLMFMSSLILTARVSANVVPTGSVSFMDGTTTLGSSALDKTGTATLSVSTLTPGAHSLTAVYGGDSVLNSSTSAPTTETVQDFQLVASSGSGTITSAAVTPGGVATFQLQVAPTNGATFIAAITLSLKGLPAGATYTITPATIAAGSSSQTITVQVQTPKVVAAFRPRGAGLPIYALGLLLPIFGVVHLGWSGERRTKRTAFLLYMIFAVAILSMLSCGGTSGSLKQAPQTYNLQLDATSGALQHSTTLNLTIQHEN